MIVLLENAIQRILPRTSHYHIFNSCMFSGDTTFNVQKLCIFLHNFSVFHVFLTTNAIPLRLCLL